MAKHTCFACGHESDEIPAGFTPQCRLGGAHHGRGFFWHAQDKTVVVWFCDPYCASANDHREAEAQRIASALVKGSE